MNELVKNESTITSVQFAEKIGKQHAHVIRDIRKEIQDLQKAGIDQSKFGSMSYKDSYGRDQLCYNMTEDGLMQLAMRYSAVERHLALELIKELKQPKLPTTYKEALQSLLIEVERNETLQLENTAQKQIIGELQPIVDYTNEILKASGSITITQIAKDYGLSGVKLNKILHDAGVQYKQSGQWLLYSQYHSMNYTESKTNKFTHKDGSLGIRVSTKWTQKGRLFIHDLLKKQEIIAVIEKQEG